MAPRSSGPTTNRGSLGVSNLTLLREHSDADHPTVEFVVTVGEESGLVGSQHLDVSSLRATHGFVFDTAGAMGAITYWAPTAVNITAVVHGRKAHAGVEPEKGINAVKVAAPPSPPCRWGASTRKPWPTSARFEVARHATSCRTRW